MLNILNTTIILERGSQMTENRGRIPIETSKICLLVRDMSWLYTYWEISPQLKNMVNKHFSLQWEDLDLRVVLTELSSGVATPVLEYIPGKEVFCQYFEVPDWQRMKAELGFMNSGGFVMLLSSEIVSKYDCTKFNKSDILPPISPLGMSSGFRS